MTNPPASTTLIPLIAASTTVIAHRPGPDADPTVNPDIVVPNTDAPGAAVYTWPSLIPSLNARPSGTYTVMISGYNWDSPSVSRTVTVNIGQYQYPGAAAAGMAYPVPSRTFTPVTDAPNGMIAIGEVTLPVSDIPPDNVDCYFGVSWTSTNPLDRIQDILFLDTMGQTIYVNIPGSVGYDNYYFDEPGSADDIGRISGSVSLRNRATTVLPYAQCSGGPVTVDPGNGLLFVYGLPTGPGLAGSYFPRWWADRLT